jgi:hypothetical protein
MKYNWIGLLSVFVTISVPLGIFFLRHWLLAWIAKRVRYGFDTKIEELRTSFRVSEEKFKSELRDKEAEINAIRNIILTGSSSRQALLDKRRFDSVEKIWFAVNDLAPLKALSAMMAVLNYDEISKDAGDPKMQQFLGVIGSSAPDLHKLKNVARDERPFVPEIAWAYFSAYSNVLYFSLIRFQMLKIGVGNSQRYVTTGNIKKILKVTLPHQARFIDEQDAGSYHFLLDEIESNLLNELRKLLDGNEADQAATQRARDIISAVNEAVAEQAKNKIDPGVGL